MANEQNNPRGSGGADRWPRRAAVCKQPKGIAKREREKKRTGTYLPQVTSFLPVTKPDPRQSECKIMQHTITHMILQVSC